MKRAPIVALFISSGPHQQWPDFTPPRWPGIQPALTFGIGGGVLIVPGLIFATFMPLPFAIGTSLVVVSALGLTTATSYAASGLLDWPMTALLIAGGAAGTIVGGIAGQALAIRKGLLERGFAAVVIAVGVFVAASSLGNNVIQMMASKQRSYCCTCTVAPTVAGSPGAMTR